MTSHELAKKLLEMPDREVWGDCVGQGGCEGDDMPLVEVARKGDEIWLKFGWAPEK